MIFETPGKEKRGEVRPPTQGEVNIKSLGLVFQEEQNDDDHDEHPNVATKESTA